MSDVLYQVRTVYDTDTKGGVASLGALSSAAGGVSGVLSGLGSMAGTVLRGAFVGGALAAGVALAGLTYGVNTLNGELDSTAVGIAGMVSAFGVAGTEGAVGWANSMSFAENAMNQIRRDAAALPGEASDFIEVFRAGLPGSLEAGMRAVDVAAFTNRFAAVGIAFRLDAPQIGRDLNLMLQGRAGAHVNMWNRLKSLVGKTAEEFNHLSAAARQGAIEGALRRYQPMIDAYANTWEAITSTTVSYGKDLLRLASNPFFNVAKKELRSLNEWWAMNEVRLDEIANGIGHRLVNAYKVATASARGLWATMDRMSASPIVNRMVDFGSNVMHGAHALASAAGAAVQRNPVGAGVAAAGAAGLAMGVPGLGLVAGGLVEFAQNTTAVNSVWSSTVAIGGNLVGVLGPLYGLFVSLESALGVLMVAALPGVMNGLEFMTTGIHDFVVMLGPSVGELLGALSPVIELFGGVLGELAGFVGSTLLDVFRELGSGMRSFLHATAQAVTWIVAHTGGSARGISENIREGDSRLQAFGMTMWDQLRGRMTGLTYEQRQERSRANLYSARLAHGLTSEGEYDPSVSIGHATGPSTPVVNSGAQGPQLLSGAMHSLRDALERLREPLTRQQGQELGAARGLARTPARNAHPVVNVHIHQTINQNEDPERIILLTRRGVMMGINAPLQSSGVRVTH